MEKHFEVLYYRKDGKFSKKLLFIFKKKLKMHIEFPNLKTNSGCCTS